MLPINQHFFFTADWKKLYDFLAHPENYPGGLILDHRYIEDLRKLMFLLQNVFAGLYDEFIYVEAIETGQFPAGTLVYNTPTGLFSSGTEEQEYGVSQGVVNETQFKIRKFRNYEPPVSGPTVVTPRFTMLVATWDRNLDRVFFWTNKYDLFEADHYEQLSRLPKYIHPVDYDNWQAGTYEGSARVFYPAKATINGITDGVLYSSKHAIESHNHPVFVLGQGYLQDAIVAFPRSDSQLYQAHAAVEDCTIPPHLDLYNQQTNPNGKWTTIPGRNNEINIPPEQNSEGWEKVFNWVPENTDWVMINNPNGTNYYRDWDFNTILRICQLDSVNAGGGSGYDSIIYCTQSYMSPNIWFPRQTDWQRQHKPVKFAKNFDGTANSGKFLLPVESYENTINKVEINRRYITQPKTLRPMFDSWAYGQDGRIFSNELDQTIVRKGYDSLKPYGGIGGNRFANHGGIKYNSPGSTGSNPTDPQRLPDLTYYTDNSIPPHIEYNYNPSVNWGLQNGAMVLLCSHVEFQKPANSLYRSNLAESLGISIGDLIDSEANNDFPSMQDPLWEEGANGYELALLLSGKYHWGFNTENPYVPEAIVCRVLGITLATRYNHQTQQDEPLYSGDWSEFDLDLAGTFERTFKHTYGRPYIFMTHITPDAGILISSWSPSEPTFANMKWFGRRTRNMPQIQVFDTHFFNIIEIEYQMWESGKRYAANRRAKYSGTLYQTKQNVPLERSQQNPSVNTTDWETATEYSFEVSGDITATLKVGYMVHFCNAAANTIDNCPDYGFVTEIFYDSAGGKTRLTTSIPLGNWNMIGCNPIISEAHDPIGFTQYRDENGEMQIEPDYGTKNFAHIMAECLEVLDIVHYHKISPNIESRGNFFPKDAEEGYNHPLVEFQTIQDAINWSIGVGSAVYNPGEIDTDPTWQQSYLTPASGCWGTVQLNYCTQKPEVTMWWNYAGFDVYAIKFTGWSPPLKGLPDNVLIKTGLLDVAQVYTDAVPHYYGQSTVLAGVEIGTRFSEPGQPQKIRWIHLPLKRSTNFHIAFPKVKYPSWHFFEAKDEYGNPTGTGVFFGSNWLVGDGGGFIHKTDNISMELQWEKVQDYVFEDFLIGYINAHKELADDTDPPEPNPPVFYIDPQLLYRLLCPYGDGLIEGYKKWDKDTSYAQDEYVTDPFEFYKIYIDPPFNTQMEMRNGLYKARCDVPSGKFRPAANPLYWEWIPPFFQDWVHSSSCLCQDEKSPPVSYQFLGVQEAAPDSEWTLDRKDIKAKVEDIPFIDAITITNIGGAAVTPGTVGNIRINVSNELILDEVIQLKFDRHATARLENVTTQADGVYTKIFFLPDNIEANMRCSFKGSDFDGYYIVEEVGSNYFKINTGTGIATTLNEVCFTLELTNNRMPIDSNYTVKAANSSWFEIDVLPLVRDGLIPIGDEWIEGTWYYVGDERTYNGHRYKCHTVHLSSLENKPSEGPSWMDFWYGADSQLGSEVIMLRAIITENDWNGKPMDESFWKFQLHARDSASPIPNVTKTSDEELLHEPDKWPFEIYLESMDGM